MGWKCPFRTKITTDENTDRRISNYVRNKDLKRTRKRLHVGHLKKAKNIIFLRHVH